MPHDRMACYIEHDPYAAGWLRNLISAGIIAPGDVDDRDIRDVLPSDLDGYRQVHLFAGIGLWSYALRMAGWSDDRPVWTASCPCQPFSQAGSGAGVFDDRHLWPAAHWLIAQQRPVTIFGEQVASADGIAWYDIVSADLEALDYTCGEVDFPSAGVGAPNIRQRLYWVAHSQRDAVRGRDEFRDDSGEAREVSGEIRQQRFRPDARSSGPVSGLADANASGLGEGRTASETARHRSATKPDGCVGAGLGSAGSVRRAGIARHEASHRTDVADGAPHPWSEPEWVSCRDGKWRPFESGAQRLVAGYSPGVGIPRAFPLAARKKGDVQKLRAYGNAINPYVAAEVIKAMMAEMSDAA